MSSSAIGILYRASRTKKSMYRFESWRIVLNFIPISQGSTKQSESTRSSLDPAGIAASKSGILSLQSPGIKTTSALGAIRLTRTFNDSMDTESFSQKNVPVNKDVAAVARAEESQPRFLGFRESCYSLRQRTVLCRFVCPICPSFRSKTTSRNTRPNCVSFRPKARLLGKKDRRPQQPSDHPG